MAEIMAAVARVNFLMRQFERRYSGGREPRRAGTAAGGNRGGREPRRAVIPDFGLVRVVQPPDDAEEITGEEGIVLAGGPVPDRGHFYTVLVRSSGETYHLPATALRFTGVSVPESDVYSGRSVRVRVDPATGEGRIVSDPD